MRISGIQNISGIFNVFHDGGIRGYEVKDADLELDIEIQYLAKRINTTFTSFKVRLFQPKNLVLEPWYDDHEKKEPYITSIERIFSPELEILGAEVDGCILNVSCNQAKPDYGYCGGFLKFEAIDAMVQDESGGYLSLKQLHKLSSSYWEEWSSKNA